MPRRRHPQRSSSAAPRSRAPRPRAARSTHLAGQLALLLILAGIAIHTSLASPAPLAAQDERLPSFRVAGQLDGAAGPVAAAVDGDRFVAAFGHRAARIALPLDGGATIGEPGPALPGHILALAVFHGSERAAALLDGHRLALLEMTGNEAPHAHSIIGLPGRESGEPGALSVAEGRIFVGLPDRLLIYVLDDPSRSLGPPVAELPLWVTTAPAPLGRYLLVPVRGADDLAFPLGGGANAPRVAGGLPPGFGSRPAWSGLRVLDVREPARPLVVADLSLAHGAPESLAGAGSIVLAGHARHASVIDATDPRRPRVVAEIEEPAHHLAVGTSPIGPPVALLASQESAFVTRPNAPSFSVDEIRLAAVDLTRPATPRVLGRHAFRGTQDLSGLAIAGGRAALADRTTGLRVLELTSPTTGLPTLARREATAMRFVAADPTTGLAVALGQAGGAAFQRAGQQRLLVVEGFSRTLRAELDGLAPAEDLVLRGEVAALVGPTGLQLVDLRNPNEPRLAGRRGDLIDARRVALTGRLALVADGAGGLRIFDVADPDRPRPLSTLPLAEPATAVVVRGEHAFVSTPRTLHAIDVSDPLRPRYLAAARTAPPENPSGPFREPFDALFDLALAGDRVYASDGFRTLHVFDVTRPARPRPLEELPFGLGGRLLAAADRLWMAPATPGGKGASPRLALFARGDAPSLDRLAELRLSPTVHQAAWLGGAAPNASPGSGMDATPGELLVAADASGLLWLAEGPAAPPTPQPTPGVTATRRPPPTPTAAAADPARAARLFLPLTLRPAPAAQRAPMASAPVLAGGEASTLTAAGDHTWLATGRRLERYVVTTEDGTTPGATDPGPATLVGSLELPSPARFVAGDARMAAVILQPELELAPPHFDTATAVAPGGYPGPLRGRARSAGTAATPAPPSSSFRMSADARPAGGGQTLPAQLRLVVADGADGADGAILRSVATRELEGPVTALHAMTVDGRRLLLLARWTSFGAGEAWLDVFDIARPAFPELLLRWPLPGAALRMADDGPRLLLSLAGTRGPDGLLVLDLRHPARPRELGFAPLDSRRGALHSGLAAIAGHAYVGLNDEWIDVLSLGEEVPRPVGRLSFSLTPSLEGFSDFAGRSDMPALHVLQAAGAIATHWDLSDLRTARVTRISQLLARFDERGGLPSAPRSTVAGGRLLVAGGALGGLRTMPLDPTTGQPRGALDMRRGGGPGRVERLVAGTQDASGRLVALTGAGDVTWMRPQSPGAFTVDAQLPGDSDVLGPMSDLAASGTAASGTQVWLTGLTTVLARLSLVDGHPQLDQILSPNVDFPERFPEEPPSPRRIAVADDMAWLAEATTGLRVFDLSTADRPRQIGLVHTPGRAQDLVLTPDHALIADGPGGLVVIDRRNPAAPREIGHLDLGGEALRLLSAPASSRVWLAVRPHALGAPRFPGAGRQGARLVEVDVADPRAPRISAELPLPTDELHGMAQRAGWLIVAAGPAGLLVIDVATPGAPRLARTVRFDAGSDALDTLQAAGGATGPAPAHPAFARLAGGGPSLPSSAPVPGALDVTFAADPSDGRIFVALGELGLATLQLDGR